MVSARLCPLCAIQGARRQHQETCGAFFPYLKHLVESESFNMRSWMQKFEKNVHPESEVFLYEDILLFVFLSRLILACGKSATKQCLKEAVSCMQLPTARDFPKPVTGFPFVCLETAPNEDILSEIGPTRTSFYRVNTAIKSILPEAWYFFLSEAA